MTNMQLFAAAIAQILADVPPGKVTTYGQLAKQAGFPGYSRQVGRFLKHLPADTRLPWHRVINSQGKISFPEDSPEFIEQIQRLRSEGISVNQGKVALRQYLWNNAAS